MLSRGDPLNAVECAAHFVSDHGGTCDHSIDHALVHQFRDQSSDTLVNVGPADP